MRKIEMVDLKSQYQKIKTEVDAAIQDVITNAQFIQGPAVKNFTNNLANYLNVKHVIPCANGTDALQIALMALNLQPGDEVISTSFTYFATVEVIGLLKLQAVFVDVDDDSFTMNIDQLKKAIGPKTKAIVPVHLYGQCANMEAILQVAGENGIPVIEDCAQAIGADYKFSDGRTAKAGTMGLVGTTSFFPSKNLGGYGDGGAMFTNDDVLADKLKMIANHGQSVKYYHDMIGCNSRLDSIQAAILNVKLKYLNQYILARQNVAAYYDNAFANCTNIQTPARVNWSNHVFHQYTMKITGDRNGLQKMLEENGIPSMLYYPVPCHKQKAFEGQSRIVGDLKFTDALTDVVISLPMHTEMDEEQLSFITQTVLNFFKNKPADIK